MAIVVEDGTGKTDSNCYMSAVQFTDKVAERGVTLTGNNGTPEQILLTAMDFIEGQDFQGQKATKEQACQWPRLGVVIDGFEVEENEIPVQLVNALYETAVAVDAGNSPLTAQERETIREKVGDIEVQYSEGSSANAVVKSISIHLDKLLAGSQWGSSVPMMRA